MTSSLKFFAGLWTLRGYPSPTTEWSLEQKFAEIKRQGFDGVGGRFIPEAPALCTAHGLDYILYLDADASDFEEQLRHASAWNPRRINVQLCDHDTPPEEAARVWSAMERLAQLLGLQIDLELHRDTATETPEKAWAIADLHARFTGIAARFSLDFSHFAVTKHLSPPFAPRLLSRPELVSNARQLHLRPFNGHHAQIPATDGQGQLTPESHDYFEFLGALFSLLAKGLGPADTLYACPENGPRSPGGYALSCFPDVWLDAIRIRDEARRLWTEVTRSLSPTSV